MDNINFQYPSYDGNYPSDFFSNDRFLDSVVNSGIDDPFELTTQLENRSEINQEVPASSTESSESWEALQDESLDFIPDGYPKSPNILFSLPIEENSASPVHKADMNLVPSRPKKHKRHRTHPYMSTEDHARLVKAIANNTLVRNLKISNSWKQIVEQKSDSISNVEEQFERNVTDLTFTETSDQVSTSSTEKILEMNNPEVSKEWNDHLDGLLLKALGEYNTSPRKDSNHKWTIVAKEVVGKTAEECKERFLHLPEEVKMTLPNQGKTRAKKMEKIDILQLVEIVQGYKIRNKGKLNKKIWESITTDMNQGKDVGFATVTLRINYGNYINED